MMDTALLNISLLARLLLSHLLADFVFQTKLMVQDRFEKKWHSKWLYVHGIIAGLLAFLFSGAFDYIWLFILYTLAHIVIDGFKSTGKDDLKYLILDQLAHMLTLLIVWVLITGPSRITGEFQDFELFGTDVWIILIAYTLVIWPSGILIGKFTMPWRQDENKKEDEGLANAGLWIGRLERFLLLTFILLSEYSLMGLLIAAKSVLRITGDKKASEYIAVGTLLSISIVVITGVATKWILDLGL
jgi:hypothetical protein